MSLKQIAAFVLILINLVLVASQSEIETETKNDSEPWEECDQDLSAPRGLKAYIDFSFLWRIIRSLFRRPVIKMQFHLFNKEFPTCGQEIRIDDDSLQKSRFNTSIPTRILIHGWMNQGKSSFNVDVKDAYLKLGDFNVIIVDWSVASSALNYFKIVKAVEDFGKIVAKFAQHLNNTMGVGFEDMYLIGHSLGAHIAGSAGKHVHPERFNTIFALDPAGPSFRGKPIECRIDKTDAKYVESIQTSVNLGLIQPVGHASFFPNRGVYQKCFGYSCSHSRSFQFFAESLNSPRGFWGNLCDLEKRKWFCPEKNTQYKMGGEPSLPKMGTFYVKTKASAPFALGRSHKYIYARK